jgi:hypothetical protein
MLGRSLRLKLAPAGGASAGVLYPGWVATPLVTMARGRDPAATAFKERVFPGRLGAFIDPDQIATAIADGIEARAARIIRPKLWGPVSALRGVFNNVSDELLRHDKATLAYIKQIESTLANGSLADGRGHVKRVKHVAPRSEGSRASHPRKGGSRDSRSWIPSPSPISQALIPDHLPASTSETGTDPVIASSPKG